MKDPHWKISAGIEGAQIAVSQSLARNIHNPINTSKLQIAFISERGGGAEAMFTGTPSSRILLVIRQAKQFCIVSRRAVLLGRTERPLRRFV